MNKIEENGETTIIVDQEEYIGARIDDELTGEFALHDYLAEKILGENSQELDEFIINHNIVAVIPEDRFEIAVSWEAI